MPQAANLLINNGATPPVEKTFTLVTPAAGDGGIAQWALKEGSISSVFPVITAMATQTGNKSRKLTLKFRLPSSYTDPVTGLTNVNNAAEVNLQVSIPQEFPESLKDDLVAFCVGMVGAPLVTQMIRDAYPAT